MGICGIGFMCVCKTVSTARCGGCGRSCFTNSRTLGLVMAARSRSVGFAAIGGRQLGRMEGWNQ